METNPTPLQRALAQTSVERATLKEGDYCLQRGLFINNNRCGHFQEDFIRAGKSNSAS